MTATAQQPDELRHEAARLAFAMLRFEEPMAHPFPGSTPPGQLVIGTQAYVFTPSWRSVPKAEIESFLVGLPSPALMSPTMTRGVIALTLIHELSGERRRWGEKTLSNCTAIFDELSGQLGLTSASRILIEFEGESHVFSFDGVRLWTQQFGVQIGWRMSPLENDPRAEARLILLRSDGKWF